MNLNFEENDPITTGVDGLEDIEASTYLGAELDKQGEG